MVREFGMVMNTPLCLQWMTKKVLLCNTWNSAQCYVAAWMEVVFGGENDTCICMAESLCCSPETITTLLIGYRPIQNKTSKKKFKKVLYII